MERAITGNTYCNFKKKDNYRFGFNTHEKVNEIAGVGNHTTALFWEYDTWLGRRWNIDPVIKPHRSPYDAFDNSPIWKVDPNGDDDYYNRKGKFIGSDGIGTRIRVMDNNAIQDKKTFTASLAYARQMKIDIAKARDMPGISREITFKNEGTKFKGMMRGAESDNRERGTNIVFDAAKAEVRTQGFFIGEKGSNDVSIPFKTGSNVYSTPHSEVTILGTIHTHQQEVNYKAKGASDKDLFESQYANPKGLGDGQMAESSQDNRYTIGDENVNYYSPEGKAKSSNNAGSRKDLESGKYNIGKEALENYGKQ